MDVAVCSPQTQLRREGAPWNPPARHFPSAHSGWLAGQESAANPSPFPTSTGKMARQSPSSGATSEGWPVPGTLVGHTGWRLRQARQPTPETCWGRTLPDDVCQPHPPADQGPGLWRVTAVPPHAASWHRPDVAVQDERQPDSPPLSTRPGARPRCSPRARSSTPTGPLAPGGATSPGWTCQFLCSDLVLLQLPASARSLCARLLVRLSAEAGLQRRPISGQVSHPGPLCHASEPCQSGCGCCAYSLARRLEVDVNWADTRGPWEGSAKGGGGSGRVCVTPTQRKGGDTEKGQLMTPKHKTNLEK